MDEINAWIGDPEANWTLCFRLTDSGSSAATFHSGCDGTADTVTVVSANGKKFGGYTPLTWNATSAYKTDSPRLSFLFSLTNSFKHLPYRYSNDIYTNSSYGPTWGGGHDLRVPPNTGSTGYCNIGHDYQCRVGAYGNSTCRNDFCGTYTFTPTEVEVYKQD
jgi:hypothetical protein